jgi:hypothetical protein
VELHGMENGENLYGATMTQLTIEDYVATAELDTISRLHKFGGICKVYRFFGKWDEWSQ